MSRMRLLHALAAVLTVVLLFFRQRWAVTAAAPAPVKRSASAFKRSACSCGDTSLTMIPQLSADCIECARAASFYEVECSIPKYKRDPDISIDNESIGQHPHDY